MNPIHQTEEEARLGRIMVEHEETITRLTAENEKLRAALKKAYDEVDLDAMDDNYELQRQLSKIAIITHIQTEN
jgi:hypothetical protein